MSTQPTANPSDRPNDTLFRYLDAEGRENVVGLVQARDVPFEDSRPVRGFTFRTEQPHTPGWYWCATTATMLAYESWLERRWLVVLDHDPTVTAIATQPMEIDAVTDGRWHHYPDFFARHSDGTCELVDVKAPNRIHEPRVVHQAERTAGLCRQLGWGHRLVGPIDSQYGRNLDWLAGFRRPMHQHRETLERLLSVAERGASIDALADCVGDDPPATRAAVFHLMWTGSLGADLHRPLRGWTKVRSRTSP